MRRGINLWAFPPDWPIRKCAELARTAGLDGIEVNLDEEGELSLRSGEAHVRAIAASAADAGVEISSVCSALFWRYPLTSNDPATQDRARKILRKMCDCAAWLGTDAVLVVPGLVDADHPIDVVQERATSVLCDEAPYARDRGVTICVENVWNKFLLTPFEMRDFIDGVAQPNVAAYFDVGNVLAFGYPEQWIRILGERIRRVHLKDFRLDAWKTTALLSGDVNWPAVREALADIGYDGYVIAELDAYKHHPESLIFETARATAAIFG